ncbi:extracellular solute-binding protein [Paracoccaceae bacterium GXU_MW_L88]
MTLNKTIRGLLLASAVIPFAAWAEPQHGIAMYGAPALEEGFTQLPYVNPEAPKGGEIVYGESGSFDSLNPYILKGRPAYGVQAHMVETLMGRNYDEPFGLYGLLAESIETDEARSFVEFTLREEATFSDGSPVTVEDVIWSMETLASDGHPRYRNAWEKVESSEQVDERTVRFTFSEADRELPLIIGLRPILKKGFYDDKDFAESGLDAPIASGPYILGDFEPGRFIEFTRNPDYWGADLPINKGQHNLDTIRYEYFVDSNAAWESFKAGEISVHREGDAQRWATQYDFPAVTNGEIVKEEVEHQRPSGMQGFVFNTRKPIFEDPRVREALIRVFNYEFINRTLNDGTLPRAESYFSNSDLGMQHGPAQGQVKELLEQYEDIPEGALEGYALPKSDGTERNRANIRAAMKLLNEAGWQVENGILQKDGQPFSFEILLGSSSNEPVTNLYVNALKSLGITANVRLIDDSQYQTRQKAYDYDMIYGHPVYGVWPLSLSPGNELNLYFGSDGVEAEGTRNYAGINSEAVDGLINTILTAEDEDTFIAATRALDRVLTAGRYIVPTWYQDVSRLAYDADLTHAEEVPMWGDWVGFLPEVWWSKSAE